MRTGKITQVERISHTHRQSPGAGEMIRIVTDLPSGDMNSFYMDTEDRDGNPIRIEGDPAPTTPTTEATMKIGDEVVFDKQKFLQTSVIWNDRKIRQRDYSFDFYSKSLYTG